MAELQITTQTIAGVTTISLAGDFDSYSAPRVRAILEPLTAAPACHVRVDLNDLEYIDSTGLGVLVAALKQATDQECHLELIAPTPAVERVLHITGLDRLFSISH